MATFNDRNQWRSIKNELIIFELDEYNFWKLVQFIKLDDRLQL